MIKCEEFTHALLGAAQAAPTGETGAGFEIARVGTVTLYRDTESATDSLLLRFIFGEVYSDVGTLLIAAEQLETCPTALPLYSSSSPSGRLIANLYARAPYDETEQALDSVHNLVQQQLSQDRNGGLSL